MTKPKTKVLPYNFTEEEKARMLHGDKCECHECWKVKNTPEAKAAARKRKYLAQQMKNPAVRKKVAQKWVDKNSSSKKAR